MIAVEVDINPADLAVNIRYKNRQYLPKRVKDAQQEVKDAVARAIEWRGYYDPPMRCTVVLDYFFARRNSDIDGPVKRTLDAIQMAFEQHDVAWNDSQVRELIVHKWTAGEAERSPGIVIQMDRCRL